MTRDPRFLVHAILVVCLLPGCGSDLRIGDRTDAGVANNPPGTPDGGITNPNPPSDAGTNPNPPSDAGTNPNPPNDSGPVAVNDGGPHDAAVPDASTPDGGSCVDECTAMYMSAATNSAPLTLSDCCQGSCTASCPSNPATCFGGGGIAGDPGAIVTCQTCAIVPLKAGTCGASCRADTSPNGCKAYMDCLAACP